MAFYDEFQKNVKEAASFTAKKATELSGIAKLKINMKGDEAKFEKCCADIGRLFFMAGKTGKDYSEEISALVLHAEKLNESIEKSREELSKLKKTIICKNCGVEFSNEYAFCPSCGNKASNDDGEECSEEKTDAE